VLTICSSIPGLQPKGALIRPDLPRLDISPKRSSADDLQRAWLRALRGAMAVGGRAQARALYEARPGGLCCGATSRRCAAWHPLDARWARAMDHGALPVDGLYWLPAPAEAAASAAHTRRAQSGVSAWVARYACVAHDERDLPVSLATGTRLMLLRSTCHDPTPDVGLFLLPCALVFFQAVAHVPYPTSLCPLYLSLPSHNQVQCCCTYCSHGFISLFIQPRTTCTITVTFCCHPSDTDSTLHAVHVHGTYIPTACVFTTCK